MIKIKLIDIKECIMILMLMISLIINRYNKSQIYNHYTWKHVSISIYLFLISKKFIYIYIYDIVTLLMISLLYYNNDYIFVIIMM